MAKQVDKTEERIEKVEQAFSRTELFIEKNQKIILIVVGVLVVIVLGYFGFNRFYLAPRETEAQGQMFMAEKYFEMDSLNKALNGDKVKVFIFPQRKFVILKRVNTIMPLNI